MEDRLRSLEQRVRADPADAESLRALAALYDRMGRRFHGRSIAGWVALLDDRWLQRRALVVLKELGPLALPAAPRAAEIEKARRDHWLEALALLQALGAAALDDLAAAYVSVDQEPAAWVLDHLGGLGAAARPILEACRDRVQGRGRLRVERALWRITGDPKPALALAEAIIREEARALFGPLARFMSELGPAARPLLPCVMASAFPISPATADLARLAASIAPDEPRLREQLRLTLHHREPARSRLAAELLSRLGPAGRPTLLEGLKRVLPRRRAPLVDALAKIGVSEAALPPLRAQLDERGRDLQLAAACALGPGAAGEVGLRLLIGSLSARPRELALRSARGLARYGADAFAAAGPLIAASWQGDSALCWASRRALLAIAPDSFQVCRRYLQRGLEQPRFFFDDHHRLARLGEAARAWLPHLERCLGDGQSGTRIAAAIEVHSLDAEDNAALTSVVLESIDQDGLAARAGLRVIRDRGPGLAEATPHLTRSLRAYSGAARAAWIVRALGAIGPPADAALDGLRRIVEDRAPADLDAALAILKIAGPDRRALAALMSAAEDVELDRQLEACGALGDAGGAAAAALPFLEAHRLRMTEPAAVRRAAADAIREIKVALDQETAGDGASHP